MCVFKQRGLSNTKERVGLVFFLIRQILPFLYHHQQHFPTQHTHEFNSQFNSINSIKYLETSSHPQFPSKSQVRRIKSNITNKMLYSNSNTNATAMFALAKSQDEQHPHDICKLNHPSSPRQLFLFSFFKNLFIHVHLFIEYIRTDSFQISDPTSQIQIRGRETQVRKSSDSSSISVPLLIFMLMLIPKQTKATEGTSQPWHLKNKSG